MSKADQLKARMGLAGPPLGTIPGEPPKVPDHELLRCIGQGSYGAVWLARNTVGTLRAIKIIHRSRFREERPYEREFTGIKQFEPLSRTNDGLVDVLQIGRNDAQGYFYYIMELADSVTDGATIDAYEPRTLAADLRRRGRLSVDDCIDLGLALTLALGHLHRHGLIHRDIKPSNLIFVQGVPKLADIGLVTDMREANSFVGTEGFVPPEGPNSVEADLYALGKVLYEASTGKDRQEFPEPFTALSLDADSRALMELNTVLLQACARRPQDRYPSANAMHADLALLRSGRSLRRLRLVERRFAQLRRATLAFCAVTLVFGGAFLYQSHQTRKMTALSAENLRLAKESEQRSQESLDNLHKLQAASGARAMEEMDYSTALLWFAEILKTAEKKSETERIQRDRIGTLFRYLPRPFQLFREPDPILFAAFTPDGDRILTRSGSTNHEQVTIRDVTSGNVLHQIQLTNSFGSVLSPSGRWMLVADGVRSRIWDVTQDRPASGELPYPKVREAVFGGDEQTIAFSGEDATNAGENEVFILEVPTGRPRAEPLRHPKRVRFIRFSRDSHFIATGCGEGMGNKLIPIYGSTRIWDAMTGQPVTEALQGIAPFKGEFSSDGKRLVTSGEVLRTSLERGAVGRSQVWDAKTGSLLTSSPWHSGPVLKATFSPDSRTLATAGFDHAVILCDSQTGQMLCPPLKHSEDVMRLEFNPDGRYLATITRSEIRFWSTRNGEPALPPIRHATGQWTSFGFSPDGSKLMAARAPDTLAVWNLSQVEPRLPPFRHRMLSPLVAAALSPNGKYAAGMDHLQRVQVWNAGTGEPSILLDHGKSTLGRTEVGLQFSPDSARVVSSTPGNTAVVWDLATARPAVPPLEHRKEVGTARFSPDGKQILTGSADDTARIWDASNGAPISPPLVHSDDVRVVEFSPDGRLAATGSRDFTVRVWRAEDGAPITPPLRHKGDVFALAFSPDGTRLAAGSADGTAIIWDVHTGQPTIPPLKQPNSVTALAFSPDGRRLLTGTFGCTATIWDTSTGQPATTPFKHSEMIDFGSFSPDGRKVVTGSLDGAVRVSSSVTGELLSPVFRHGWNISGARFTPDGGSLFTASWDTTAQIWEIPTLTWPAEDILLLAQLLTGESLDPSGKTAALEPAEMEARWHKLRGAYPGQFSQTSEELILWHRRRLVTAEVSQEWFAAAFHLDRLRRVAPDDPLVSEAGPRVIVCQPYPRAPETSPRMIDLSRFYNTSLAESMDCYRVGYNLAELPKGIQRLAGVDFDVRGIIRLNLGRRSLDQLYLPKGVQVPVKQMAKRLHFLHASEFGDRIPGENIGSYVIRFANGLHWEVPIVYGEDLRDWYSLDSEDEAAARAEVAWRGASAESRRLNQTLRLYKRTWENPNPDLLIESVELSSSNAGAKPFLIAVTAE